jgi:hypothetical protein
LTPACFFAPARLATLGADGASLADRKAFRIYTERLNSGAAIR